MITANEPRLGQVDDASDPARGIFNQLYLASCGPLADPTLVWGSFIDMEPIEAFLENLRRSAPLIPSTPHILLRAVVAAIACHPHFNRRVVRRKVREIDGINVLMPLLRSSTGHVSMMYLRHAERMGLHEICQRLWMALRNGQSTDVPSACRDLPGNRWLGWLEGLRRYWHIRSAPIFFYLANRLRYPNLGGDGGFQQGSALVNYFAFPGGPPMHYFKPSSLPVNAPPVYVALGPTMPHVVVRDQVPTVGRVALLVVKADHRIVDAPRLAAFVATLRHFLQKPGELVDGATCPSHGVCLDRVASDLPAWRED